VKSADAATAHLCPASADTAPATCTSIATGTTTYAAAAALRASYAAGLNDLLIITGCVALAGAVCALLLIRSRDFAARDHPAAAPPAGERAGAEEGSQIPS
jgi:hypothetical protein